MSTRQWLPLPEWLASYRRDWLQADIIAGMTTGAVIIGGLVVSQLRNAASLELSAHPRVGRE